MDKNIFLESLNNLAQIYCDIMQNKKVKIFNLPEQSNWYHVFSSGVHIFSIYEHYDDLLNAYEYKMQLGNKPVFTFYLDNKKNTEVFKTLHELNMLCISKFDKQSQPIMQKVLSFIKCGYKQK